MALRGIDSSQELDPSQLLRDTRTLGQRVGDFFKERTYVAILIVMCTVLIFFIPATMELTFIFILGFYFYSKTRILTLPFRLPSRAKIPDHNDPIPGTTKPRTSRGITFFGNHRDTMEEVWFTNDDMRTHCLIFGSTGSGKTEALVSIAFNSLIHGSGFIYVDGKGDNSLFAKVFSMVRGMGREDDMLLINFMTGARDVIGPQERRLSNTMNPFSRGSSSMLAQLVTSLMDSGSGSGDGDMWKGRAISFVESLMKVLVYMRDDGHILLDANVIRNYFHLERLETIVMDKMFPRDNDEPVSLHDVPDLVMEPIKNYVLNLPGYNKERKGKQVSQVLEQHGFITMQLTKVFGSLADTYSHIIRTNLPEVDLKDVVLNRRILVTLLPALEKSPDELANLGKVIIASLKAMMAAGLGDEVEGDYRDVIERKPTNAPSPYVCILDEYGYYAVQGFAVVPAQARSLGFSTIFAGQDLPAFQKSSKEEAASIGANTNIKICMKLEDPAETWEFFQKTAGEAYVTKVDSFQTNETSLTSTYKDTKSASFEKRSRVDLLDLKDQSEGMAHIFFKSKIVRAKMFYANPPPVKRLRMNHFLKVDRPPDEFLIDFDKRMDRFAEIAKKEVFFDRGPVEDDIVVIAELMKEKGAADPIEHGVSVLLSYHNRHIPEEVDSFIEEESMDEMNLFTNLRMEEAEKERLRVDDIERFSQPLVDKSKVLSTLHSVERITGRDDKQAMNIASEIIKDMQTATHYPPEFRDNVSAEEMTAQVESVVAKFQEMRAGGGMSSSDDGGDLF